MRNDRSIRKNTRSTNTEDTQVVTTQQKKETVIRETVDTKRTPRVFYLLKKQYVPKILSSTDLYDIVLLVI